MSLKIGNIGIRAVRNLENDIEFLRKLPAGLRISFKDKEELQSIGLHYIGRSQEYFKIAKQGEALKMENTELKKYRQTWEEFKRRFACKMIDINEEKNTFSLLFDAMDIFEQKYFPKPVKKTITKEEIK